MDFTFKREFPKVLLNAKIPGLNIQVLTMMLLMQHQTERKLSLVISGGLKICRVGWCLASNLDSFSFLRMEEFSKDIAALGLEPPRRLHRLYDFVVSPGAGQVAVARNIPATHRATQRTEPRDARMEAAEQGGRTATAMPN